LPETQRRSQRDLTPDTYFKTQSDLDASVAAIYTELTPDYSFGFTTRMTACFGADDLTTDPGLNKGDMRAFDELNGASTNSQPPKRMAGALGCGLPGQ
jgi:hypothetical protein